MINIIRKEFKVSRMWLFLLGLSLVFSLAIWRVDYGRDGASVISFSSNLVFAYGVFLLVYLSVIVLNDYEIQNKSYILFNSFPLDRNKLVGSRYLLVLIYMILYSIPMGLTNKIIIPLIYEIESPLEIFKSFGLIIPLNLILYSIYFPFYFKSRDGLLVLNQVTRILVVLAPSIVAKLARNQIMGKLIGFLGKMGNKQLSTGFLIFSLVLYYISLQVSKRIYSRKEFF